MQGAQIIVLATPVFLLLIAIEFVVGWARGRNTYRLNDALNSIGLGIMSQIAGVFTKAMTVGIYAIVYVHFAWLSLSEKSIAVWLGALLLYDLCYYWHHRLGHTCALFWAAHVVHHQSEDYNLSTALRQTSSTPTTALVDAGIRIELLVSVPVPTTAKFALTAVTAPPEDPPGLYRTS